MSELERIERVARCLRQARGVVAILGASGDEINDMLSYSIKELDEIAGAKIAAEYMTGKV